MKHSTIYQRYTDEEMKNEGASSVFTSSDWLNMIESVYDLNIRFIQHNESDTGFYFANVDRPNFQKIVSLPFSDYIIPTVERDQHLNELFTDLKSHYPNAKIVCDWILPESVSLEKLKPAFSQTAYLHKVPISTFQEVKSNMSSSFRNKVNQAKRENLSTEICRDLKSLEEFYETYYRLRIDKFKKIPQSFTLFEKVYQLFFSNDQGFLIKVKLDDVPIAFAICLEYGGEIYVKYSSSAKEYLNYRPNNIMYNDLFQYACDKNVKAVDLGLSGISKNYEGLVQFKKSMGGVPFSIMHAESEPESYNHEAEEKLQKLTGEMVDKIVETDPGAKITSQLSRAIYPYFC